MVVALTFGEFLNGWEALWKGFAGSFPARFRAENGVNFEAF